MNEIRTFESADFGQIRTVVIDSEPWFVAKDIAERLGYAETTNMRKLLDDTDYRAIDPQSAEFAPIFLNGSIGKGVHNMLIINESGLYAAIFGSKQDNAKKFKKWVTSDVLPAIRKTGSYTALPATTDDKIALLAQGHQELREDIEAVRIEASRAKAEVSELKQSIEDFKMDLPLFPSELQEIVKAVNARVISQMGGKQSNAYKNRIIRSAVFGDIYSEIHRNFECASYKSIPRRQLKPLLMVVNGYIPPYSLRNDIEKANGKFNPCV